MAYVFVSHNSTNDGFVDKLAQDLKAEGINTFVDHHHIKGGQRWPDMVREALKQCQKMIAVISPSSIESRNCQNEWYKFINENKEVIPVWLSGNDMYFEFSVVQNVDFRNGNNYQKSFHTLVNYLKDTIDIVPQMPPRYVQEEDPSTPLRPRRRLHYPISRLKDKYIGIATGNIAEIVRVDVLVNSVNTDLFITHHQSSVSAALSFYAAKHDEKGQVVKYTLDLELQAERERRGLIGSVPPGTVISTSSGSLSNNGVRHILHVVSTWAKPTTYISATDIELGICVLNALHLVDEMNANLYSASTPLKTLVFPLFAVGGGHKKVEDIAPRLVEHAIEYLMMHQTHIREVYFIAYTKTDFEALKQIYDCIPDLGQPQEKPE